jgi:hypothetical protein
MTRLLIYILFKDSGADRNRLSHLPKPFKRILEDGDVVEVCFSKNQTTFIFNNSLV